MHICEVEIDPDTGETKVDKYTAVDDFGRIINPMIVEGRYMVVWHKELARHFMKTHYEETGQLVTASYMDYTMPRADNSEFNMDCSCTETTSTTWSQRLW